jgi:hypothetical protein
MSVRLFNSTGAAAVAGTTVTVNVDDLPLHPATANLGGYWMYFKFASPVTLLAATLYAVQANTSVASQVTLSANATLGNWNRCLVTSTNGTPVATDTLIVAGEHTAQGVGVDYTITYDGIGATIFGGGAATNPALEVGRRGSFAFGTTASTAYQFICNGDIRVGGGGTFSIGTTANSMPASSSGYVQFNSVSANQWGIRLRPFANFLTCGATKTGRETLATDAAVGATNIRTTTSTGWLAGDVISIAPTTINAALFDRRTLASNAVGATVSLTAGLTNAKTIHSGTEVEIINVTRNVRIQGGGAAGTVTLYSQHSYNGQTNLDVRNTQFVAGGWTNQIEKTPFSNSIRFQGCSFVDLSSTIAVWTDPAISTFTTAVWSDCVMLNIITFTNALSAGGGLAEYVLIEDVWMMSMSSGGMNITTANAVFTVNRCRFIASAVGIQFGNTQNYQRAIIITNSVFKVCGAGLSFLTSYYRNQTNVPDSISGNKMYLNNVGIQLSSCSGWIIGSFEAFSNSTASITVAASTGIIIKNGTITRGTTIFSPIGISLTSTVGTGITFENCTIGPNHATGDISNANAQNAYDVRFRNCSMLSGTEIANQSTMNPFSVISSARHDQINKNNYIWKLTGTQRVDDTIFRSSPLSIRMTPIAVTGFFYRFESTPFIVPVKAGQSLTIGVWVRMSGSSDSSTYTGSAPRLILKSNSSAFSGTSDIVLSDGAGVSTQTWTYISGTTPIAIDDSAFEIVVDCNGSTGWINFADFFVSSQNSTRSLKYYFEGAPVPVLNSNNGSSVIFV